MADEKQHHFFHHHKDDDTPQDTTVYAETQTVYTTDASDGYVETTEVISAHGQEINYKKEEKHHKHLKELGELGIIVTGAYALYEKHEAKKDPEHAHKHKIEEEIAAAAAVGSEVYNFANSQHKYRDPLVGYHQRVEKISKFSTQERDFFRLLEVYTAHPTELGMRSCGNKLKFAPIDIEVDMSA